MANQNNNNRSNGNRSNGNSYEKKSAQHDQNITIITGRIGRVDDLKYTQAGKPFLSFSVANSQDIDRKGEIEDRTLWYRVTLWGEFAEKMNAKKTLNNVALINVSGLVVARAYKTNDGEAACSMEFEFPDIKFVSWKPKDQQVQGNGGGDGGYGDYVAAGGGDNSNDIPF